jgi:hypothetical protein
MRFSPPAYKRVSGSHAYHGYHTTGDAIGQFSVVREQRRIHLTVVVEPVQDLAVGVAQREERGEAFPAPDDRAPG